MNEQLPIVLILSFATHIAALFHGIRVCLSGDSSGKSKSIAAAISSACVYYLIVLSTEATRGGVFRVYSDVQVLWQAYLTMSGFLFYSITKWLSVRRAA